MTDKIDRQDGDGLEYALGALRTIAASAHDTSARQMAAIAQAGIDLVELGAAECAKMRGEGAGDDLPLDAEHPINYRKAFAKPAPDAMREAQIPTGFCSPGGKESCLHLRLRERCSNCPIINDDDDRPATCNHWPGQKRCGVCGMGSELLGMLADATRRLEDSNDILVCLIDAEAQVERLRRKLEEIHSITQDTTPRIECWEKIQNIEATAASALAPVPPANGALRSLATNVQSKLVYASPPVRGDREAVAGTPWSFGKFFHCAECEAKGENHSWRIHDANSKEIAKYGFDEETAGLIVRAVNCLSLPVQPGAGERPNITIYRVEDDEENLWVRVPGADIATVKLNSKIGRALLILEADLRSRQAPRASSETES